MANSLENALQNKRDIPDVPAEDTALAAKKNEQMYEDLASAPDAVDKLASGFDILSQLALNPTSSALANGTPEDGSTDESPIPSIIEEAAPARPATQSRPKPGLPIKAAPIEEEETKYRGSIMTVEDAKEAGIDTEHGTIIDPANAAAENAAKDAKRRQEAENNDMMDMAKEVIGAEAARMQRLENTLALPDDDPRKQELLGPMANRKVATVEDTTVSTKDREKDDRQMGLPGYDESDLLPAYTADEEEAKENTPEAEEDDTPKPGEDAYAEYVRGLEQTDIIPAPKPVMNVLRDPMVEDVIEPTSKKSKKAPQNLGDQAFMNAITRFKQERFGKVAVPLVNSGFYADMVGTGVVDLQNLYLNVSEDTKVYEYQMEQMRVIIRNITGTNPKIDPTDLRNKIHFKDFPLMAFAHVCATLKTVESVANCTECDMPFRITTRPHELLTNMDELAERAAQIANSPNIESHSLMSKYKIITTAGGMVVTLGHPSYANELTILNSFLAYYNNMTPADGHRFQSRLEDMYFIRKIQLPTGVVTNSILQIYLALGLMSDTDLKCIQEEIAKMRSEILEPKFGIREVKCPHCGKIVKNITYRNILDLLFLHFQLKGYLEETTSKTSAG